MVAQCSIIPLLVCALELLLLQQPPVYSWHLLGFEHKHFSGGVLLSSQERGNFCGGHVKITGVNLSQKAQVTSREATVGLFIDPF